MKRPKVSIAAIMGVVLIAALDFAAVRPAIATTNVSLTVLSPRLVDGYVELAFRAMGVAEGPATPAEFLLALAGGWFLRRDKIHVTIERRKATP